jgi:hypothetical protein
VKGWARRGSEKKKETKNLFIEDIIRLPCASEEYVIRSTHKHKPHLYALPSSSFALWERVITLSILPARFFKN